MARENTIHSLNSAADNGADFVEFDVQLTKDKVVLPVVDPGGRCNHCIAESRDLPRLPRAGQRGEEGAVDRRPVAVAYVTEKMI